MKNGNQTKRRTIQVEESSGNVFADLGLPNAQELQAKSSAIAKIFVFLREHSLSEEDAARHVGVPTADLAAILRGDLDRFSIKELKQFLQSLLTATNGHQEGPKVKKIALSDGSGNWFDLNSAKKYHENISPEEMQHRGFDPDRGDWLYGETLYYTTKGSFVLCRWHKKFDTLYSPIGQDEAVRWLIANGHQNAVQQLEFQSEERKLEV